MKRGKATTPSRADELFYEQSKRIWVHTDRLFVWLMLFQWVAGVVAALTVSPLTWKGVEYSVHIHVWAAVFLGGLISFYPVWLAVRHPGETMTRHVMAVAQMLMGALLIHLCGGRIETHFHIFGSLAFLAFYRDPKVLLTGAIVVYFDHFIRGVFWPESVFGVFSAPIWRPIEHAGWVAFECWFLYYSIRQSHGEMMISAQRQAELESANVLFESRVKERTSELERSKADADESERLLRSILNILPERVFWTNEVGEIQDSNHRFMIDMNVCEIHGAKLEDLPIPKEILEELKPYQLDVLENGKQVFNLILEAVPKASNLKWLSLSLVPLLRADGSVHGILYSYQDVTELKNAEATALESARLKSEFLANMSHEIRTPMNGVIGMTHHLLESDLSDDQREYASTVKHSAESLLAILNDILDLSKIEASKLEIESIDFNLQELVEETLDIIAESAQSKGLELIGSFAPELPIFVSGDPGRLRQILINLLGNAVKFTQSGEVLLRVDSVKRDNSSLSFEVTDTGIGISAAAQKRLFEAFSQADGSTTRQYGGTGLGLTICKRLLELMGGSIEVESVVDKGTRIRFELPLPAAKLGRTATKREDLQGLRMMVVDDNETNRDVLTLLLKKWGVASESAGSAGEALKVLEKDNRFDMIVLDMQMPEMDGMGLARKIREISTLQNIPMVMLTSLNGPVVRSELNLVGIEECLQKPVRQDRLYNSLRQHSPKQSKRISAKRRKAPSRVLEQFDAKILLAEDNRVNQRVAQIQLKKLGCEADIVENGLDAVEAFRSNDYDLILMDCQMPIMEGYDATRSIRKIEEERGVTHGIYIIAFTAHAMEGDRIRCLDAGMNDYVSKPILTDSLLQAFLRFKKYQETEDSAG
tara:strand:- start:2644 stop:5277 length:2634 start_codon:yes stop_codon:yes gene_type:complete